MTSITVIILGFSLLGQGILIGRLRRKIYELKKRVDEIANNRN